MEKDTNPKDALGTAKWRQFMTVPRQVLWELGVAMLEGALKYGRHNYRASGVRASVYLDAAYGHLDQFTEGEDIDKDSGLSHITKAIASLVVLRDAMMNDFWVDDRPPAIKDLDGVRDFLQAKVVENLERYADKDPHHYTQLADQAPYQYGWPWGGLANEPQRVAPMTFDTETHPENDFRAFGLGEPPEAVKQAMMAHGDDVFQVNLGSVDPRTHEDVEAELLANIRRTMAEQDDQPQPEEFLEESGFHSIFESLFGSLPEGYVVESQRVGDIEILHIGPGSTVEGPEVAFDDPMAFASFADGGFVSSGIGEDIPIEITPEWNRLTSKDMHVGRTYKVTANHLGDPVEDGVEWTIRRKEGDTAFGVKPGWRDDHPGVRLSESTFFSDVTVPLPDDWNAGDDDLATEEILSIALSTDIQTCAAHLEDPTYTPYDKLDVLGDDDPTQIIRVAEDAPNYDQSHIVEGLTQKQLDNLTAHEAATMAAMGNTRICRIGHAAFMDHHVPHSIDKVSDMVVRRVLIRLKAQPLRQVRLDFPTGGSSERSTRLTNEQWFVAVPGVRVTEMHGARLFKPDSFA